MAVLKVVLLEPLLAVQKEAEMEMKLVDLLEELRAEKMEVLMVEQKVASLAV